MNGNLRSPFAVLAAMIWLSACGGGGSGAASPAPAAPPGAAGFSELEPGSTMDWVSSREAALAVEVIRRDGSPAPNAVVRVFTFTMIGPHDNATLEQPVPQDQLAVDETDASGRLTINVRAASRWDQVLFVVSYADAAAVAVVPFAAGGVTRIQLSDGT